MKRTKEYYEKCMDIYTKGGFLWLVERTDTKEFLQNEPQMWQSNKPETWHEKFRWDKNIGFFNVFFLTKEDAQSELQFMNLTEGGCYSCGYGSTKIPVEVTEHEFVGKN